MKAILLLLVILLLRTSAHGTITSAGNLGNCTSIISGTTCIITTGAILEVGHIAVVDIAFDNTATTDGTSSEITSVTDSVGNTYTPICAYRNGNGGIALGAAVASYFTKATVQLPVGGTITITFANAIVAKAAQAQEYTIAAGNTLQLAGTCQIEAVDSADPGALVISGLTSKEYLLTRAIAFESVGATLTPTANYTINTNANATTGTTSTSMALRHERRILTGTGDTSNPAYGVGDDNASIFYALEEVLASVQKRRRYVIVTE